MNSITKTIVGLVGLVALGLITYYFISNDKEPVVVKKTITTPSHDTIATVHAVKDTTFNKIKTALNIDGEEFNPTTDEGVYINKTKDKLLMINEDVWKKMIRKAKKKFPNISEDCNDKYPMPTLTEYDFVGLLTYFVENNNSNTTIAYSAIEIRKGKAKTFAGGNICCTCEGEPLVSQKVDAVIVK
jgi:hypothetical protein